MKKQPQSITAGKNSLRHAKQEASAEIEQALIAASEAIDQVSQENLALRRILISERAQVIYYSGKYQAFVKRECVEVLAVGFLDLPEDRQEELIKLAVQELHGEPAINPHDPEENSASAETGKKIILQ